MQHNARMRHVAIGDPQASFERLIAILEVNGLLTESQRLRDDVHLVSMGDHFDYGKPEAREAAAADGEAILTWLASHPADQVTLLLGNHDLARVGELAPFDDETFLAAHREARAVYAGTGSQAALLAKYPTVPDAECLARDYACFTVAQQRLVTRLLREGRFRLAAHHEGLLLVHAGVTVDDLALARADPRDAASAAAGLNAFLDARLVAWAGGALDLAPFHQLGSPATGEGRGALYHRPCDPASERPDRLEGPPRRRFDPRTLPASFPQAIGHIRDTKCRELMPGWSPPGPAVDGPLRSLVVGDSVRYQLGVHDDARLVFTDGGMSHAAPNAYQLLDLDRRQPLVRR